MPVAAAGGAQHDLRAADVQPQALAADLGGRLPRRPQEVGERVALGARALRDERLLARRQPLAHERGAARLDQLEVAPDRGGRGGRRRPRRGRRGG